MRTTPLSVSSLAIVTRSGGKSATVWDAIKKRANANNTVIGEFFSNTLNKIFLLNNGAKVTAQYTHIEKEHKHQALD